MAKRKWMVQTARGIGPKSAVYRGQGSTEDARSFDCAE